MRNFFFSSFCVHRSVRRNTQPSAFLWCTREVEAERSRSCTCIDGAVNLTEVVQRNPEKNRRLEEYYPRISGAPVGIGGVRCFPPREGGLKFIAGLQSQQGKLFRSPSAGMCMADLLNEVKLEFKNLLSSSTFYKCVISGRAALMCLALSFINTTLKRFPRKQFDTSNGNKNGPAPLHAHLMKHPWAIPWWLQALFFLNIH